MVDYIHIRIICSILAVAVGDYQRSMSVPLVLDVEDMDTHRAELSSSFDLRRTINRVKASDFSQSPPSTNSFLA